MRLRGTVLTRTELTTVGRGVVNGSIRLGFDLVKNEIAEFWPDVKRKISRRQP